MYIAISL